MGMAIAGIAAGAVGAAVIYGGLAFSSTLSANAKAGIGAGIGLAGGLLVGMAAPEIGVGIASGGIAVAAAQLATSEVATYEANQSNSTSTSTSTSAVNGPGDRPLSLHQNPRSQLASAKLALQRRGFR
jgi:hypothetical protein